MDAAELIKKVRKIEIKTKGLSNQLFSGEYHSAFKGRGMAFSEVREYFPGDDIRAIDWNVTARFNHPYIKVFEEERELNVVLMIDVSASETFGTNRQLKKELITEVSAVLSFSAIQNNDKISVIFFSDQIEKFIPPKKGKSHILRIIRELITLEPKSKKTDLGAALRYLNNVIKKKSIVFLISDFKGNNFEDALRIANKRNDVVAIQINDIREHELTNIGLIEVMDAETGTRKWIDTTNKEVRSQIQKNAMLYDKKLKETFLKCGVDNVYLQTGHSYIKPLMSLFRKRER